MLPGKTADFVKVYRDAVDNLMDTEYTASSTVEEISDCSPFLLGTTVMKKFIIIPFERYRDLTEAKKGSLSDQSKEVSLNL